MGGKAHHWFKEEKDKVPKKPYVPTGKPRGRPPKNPGGAVKYVPTGKPRGGSPRRRRTRRTGSRHSGHTESSLPSVFFSGRLGRTSTILRNVLPCYIETGMLKYSSATDN